MRGYTINRDDYLNRLRRIEGQVRGLQRMIEADEYCIDVLTQLSSVTAALQSLALGLVDEHLRHCVMQAALVGDESERDAKLTEAVHAVSRLVRS
jgi:DNA-binding FrmR family transcriptional regulator